MYLHRLPAIIRFFLPTALFEGPDANAVYISFDDGPEPSVTPWVLEQLDKYNAKATFFVLGKNVLSYPDIYDSIKLAGHSIGNHTHSHLNGAKVKSKDYVADVLRAEKWIASKLFRPPYGRITRRQAHQLEKKGFQLVLWSLLPGDFDTELKPEDCAANALLRIKPGDIVVLHDSQKAWPRLEYLLPRLLAHCQKQDWAMKPL